MRPVRVLRVSLALALALALGLAPSSLGCSHDERSPLPGVRLGMTPRDVRERFEGGEAGTWQTKVGTGDDTVIDWASEAGDPTRVRFEFHMGMLVAIRARFRDDASGAERVSATGKTVTVRGPAPDGGTAVTLLSRDCPTHRDEAERLLKAAPR